MSGWMKGRRGKLAERWQVTSDATDAWIKGTSHCWWRR